MTMEKQAYLPLQMAIKYYSKWDCDTQMVIQNGVYFKCLNGLGKVSFLNGNHFHGSFQKGLMHGKGTYTWKSGLIYQGDINNNQVDGEGTLTWPDGSKYKGSVHQGKRHGQGEYTCAVDDSTYRGQWQNGAKHGHGTLVFKTGAVYQGTFKSGLREGRGKMRYPSGNEYQGNWVNDKKSGKGCMTWTTSFEKYDGIWANDQPDGQGTYYWFEPRSQSKAIKTIFKGSWKSGKRQGLGVFYHSGGCRIQGNFKNNAKEGVFYIEDEFGEGHLQPFSNDKSMLKQEHLLSKADSLKLKSVACTSAIHNQEPASNNYNKYLDVKDPLIDTSICNLLLRENSQLRHTYKVISSTKDSFPPLGLEAVWRLFKDLKLADQRLTLARINRSLSQGIKSQFKVDFPVAGRLQLAQEHSQLLNSTNYSRIEWELFQEKVKSTMVDWESFTPSAEEITVKQLFPGKMHFPHDPLTPVLYRNFVTILVRIAFLQYNSGSNEPASPSFRQILTELLTSIKSILNPVPSLLSEKVASQGKTNISHQNQTKLTVSSQYTCILSPLFSKMTKSQSQLLNCDDRTISVRQLYSLLCQSYLLKQSNEKMMFLERVQRPLRYKTPFLKKQYKQHYPTLEKTVLCSPYFEHIVNYELIETEFNEIMHLFLNRKIGNTQSKDQFIKKYSQIIEQLSKIVTQNGNKVKKASLKKKNLPSQKDMQKVRLLERLEQERLEREKQARKLAELAREEEEKLKMEKEDMDIKDDDSQEESEEYYD